MANIMLNEEIANAANASAKVAALKIENVESVYSGRDGKCCCGCSGKYFYSSRNIEAGSSSRGYQVTPDEVNDKMVTKVLNILKKNAADVEFGGNYYSVVIGRRVYIAYVLLAH